MEEKCPEKEHVSARHRLERWNSETTGSWTDFAAVTIKPIRLATGDVFCWAVISGCQLRARRDQKSRVSVFSSLLILSLTLFFFLFFNPPRYFWYFWSVAKHLFYSLQLKFYYVTPAVYLNLALLWESWSFSWAKRNSVEKIKYGLLAIIMLPSLPCVSTELVLQKKKSLTYNNIFWNKKIWHI